MGTYIFFLLSREDSWYRWIIGILIFQTNLLYWYILRLKAEEIPVAQEMFFVILQWFSENQKSYNAAVLVSLPFASD